MRNLIFSCICLFIMQNQMFAQQNIPNSSFDNWTLFKPVGWFSFEDFLGFPLGGVMKDGVDKVSGPYSISIHTITALGEPIPNILALGEIPEDPPQSGMGIPFTDRPDSIHIIHKYNTVEKDTGICGVTLLKTGQNLVMGYVTLFENTNDQWVYQSIDLKPYYISNDRPDSLVIIISNSLNASAPQPNSVLKMDGIYFSYGNSVSTPGGQKYELIKLNAFPNPSLGEFCIESDFDLANHQFVIFDMLGTKIFNQDSEGHKTRIDLTKFPKGIYSILLMDKEGLLKGRLKVQKQ